MNRARAPRLAAALSAVVLVGLAACGQDTAAGPGALTPVTIVIGNTINFAAPHVALEKGFWKDEGLDVDLVNIQHGAPTALASMIQGDSFMAFTGGPTVIAPIAEGAPLQLLVTVGLGYSVELTGRAEFLKDRGITADSSIADKVKALRGARLGYDTPGGSMDRFYRHILGRYGLDADKDTTMIALNNPQGEMAALRQGKIDVMAGSPPVGVTAEFEGAGTLFLRPSEVPGLKDYPYLIGSTTKKQLADRPAQLEGVIRGLQRAFDFLGSDPDACKAIVRKSFPDMRQEAFDAAFKDVLPVIPDSPLITKKSFGVLADFERSNGSKADFDYAAIVPADFVTKALGKER
ncbi:ABC transporter substrate-binding protein [Actinophytocola sp.]|uniref:ABC transporter substrate-binding protein n=1 Tax=Actinophytocola sp. TaxID=1872138 RepID=UPI002EDB84FA